MRKLFLTTCLLISTSILPAELEEYHNNLTLFQEKCFNCHDMEFHFWPRSFKSWQLTVENMRTYAYGDNAFSKDDGLRIAEFLAEYVAEGELLKPETEQIQPEPPPQEDLPPVEPELLAVTEPQTETPSETAAPMAVASEEPTAPLAAVTMKPTQPSIKIPLRKRIWNPSRNALRGARTSGYLSVIFLTGLLLSGFNRKRLKRRFRKIHVVLALGLFLSLSTHGIIYIAKYGTPSVTWYWFGLIGFIALVTTEIQGIIRKRFHKGLLISHIMGACFGLSLSILHWIWAWL